MKVSTQITRSTKAPRSLSSEMLDVISITQRGIWATLLRQHECVQRCIEYISTVFEVADDGKTPLKVLITVKISFGEPYSKRYESQISILNTAPDPLFTDRKKWIPWSEDYVSDSISEVIKKTFKARCESLELTLKDDTQRVVKF